jgi:MFS family permease
VLVGVAGALVLPLSLGLVHLAFAGDGKQRDRAITRYVVSSALAALAAALLGGALRSLPDWRLAFVPPILLGLLAIVLVWRNVAESRALPHERYVVEGDSASTWVLLALAFGLHLYWVAGPYAIYVLLASLSAVALGAFVLLRSDYRASGLRLTLNWRRRWSRTVLTIFGVAMNIAVTGYLAQAHGALRVVYGYGGLVALLAMLPYVAGTLLVSRPVFQRGAARLGHRESMAAGLALVSLSCLATWLLFGAGSYLALALVMASFGIGSTMASSAWTASYLGAMSGELIGVRTGMNTAIGRTGDVVGMTLTTALLATVGSGDYLQRLRSEGVTEERIQRANEALNSLLHPATVAAVTTDPRIAEYLLAGYRLSYLVAFERVMLVLTVISLLASALAWVGLRSRESHAVISVATEQNR